MSYKIVPQVGFKHSTNVFGTEFGDAFEQDAPTLHKVDVLSYIGEGFYEVGLGGKVYQVLGTSLEPILYEVCGKGIENFHNHCVDWACHVKIVKRAGGTEHLPNRLPVRCIRWDGLMLECEGGDHPDYIFPVEARYVGKEPEPDNIGADREQHALIYADEHIAVTLYEHCYAMWYLKKGNIGGGSLWEKGDWVLTEESLQKIKKYLKSKRKEMP